MKILATTFGDSSIKRYARYMSKIAISFDAEIFLLYLLQGEEFKKKGKKILEKFSTICNKEGVAATTLMKVSEVVPAIIESAEELAVDLIIFEADGSNIVREWLSADLMSKTSIPVLTLPKLSAHVRV